MSHIPVNSVPIPSTQGGTGLSALPAASSLLGVKTDGSAYQGYSLGTSGGASVTYSGSTITIGSPSGTVTSVALSSPAEFTVSGSPVTGSGTLTLTKASQTANTGWLAPDGSAGAPSFRSLVNNDLPTVNIAHGGIGLTSVPAASALLGVSADGTQYQGYSLQPGTDITITTTGSTITIGSVSGAGTVTSVAMTVPSDLSVSGSPITTSGTLAVTRNSQSANLFLSSPDGSAGVPTYRSVVNNDLPTVNIAHGGIGLTAVPAASALLGVNANGTGYQGYSLQSGTNVSISTSGSTITVSSTATSVTPLASSVGYFINEVTSGGVPISAPIFEQGGALTGAASPSSSSFKMYTVSGTFTVTLPNPSGINQLWFRFKNIGTGTVTWDVSGGGNIDGSSTFVSNTQWQSLDFQIINGAWYVV